MFVLLSEKPHKLAKACATLASAFEHPTSTSTFKSTFKSHGDPYHSHYSHKL